MGSETDSQRRPERDEVWEAQQEVGRLRDLLKAAVAKRDRLVAARYPKTTHTTYGEDLRKSDKR